MELVLYRLSLSLYALVVRLASLYNPKAKLFIEGRKGLQLKIKAQLGKETRPRIWMHCASLGEFEQGRPVLELLRKQYPNYAIVLTFFSPSGYQVMRKYNGVDYVYYLPLDTASNAKQFILNVHPDVAIFVKYDLWYFYLNELQAKQIPSILIDAIFRPQQGFFKWYGGIQRQMLQMMTQIFVQNEYSKQLLQSIGISQVSIAGDTRFDRVLSVAQLAEPIERMDQLAEDFYLLIAGSTWAEDERLLADFLPQMPPSWKLVIAPHDVDEKRLQNVENLFGNRMKRWSEWEDGQSLNQQVLVIDSIGLLLKIYRYGRIAWIGGGLGKGGVHNVLEAAVYGLPCAFGPQYQKYQEAKDLIEHNAAISCKSAADFIPFFKEADLGNDAYKTRAQIAQNYVSSRAGASPVIVNYLVAKNWLKTL